ncbi:MAG: alpha/beta hydrolase-fold protein [Ignavibacteria bacterium]|nr:alpha/beta hydrolase-fold protein [Ignavibacteria bacterium]
MPKPLFITKDVQGKRFLRSGRDKIVGDVIYHREQSYSHLNHKRDIIVWLPPSYKIDRTKHYPVLYMHDGQNIMDPKTAYIGVDWRVDETVSKLIKSNLMNEVIIVGIYNSPDRLEEYSDSVKGHHYLKYLATELKEFIDSNYRTLTDRENTSVMGSSMGGLISFLLVWIYPNVFSKTACLSSAFYFDNNKVFRMIEKYEGLKKHIKIYIDSGEDGKRDAQKMFSLLTSKGYIIGEDLDYYYDKGALHTEKAWGDRLERPLLFFLGKKSDGY